MMQKHAALVKLEIEPTPTSSTLQPAPTDSQASMLTWRIVGDETYDVATATQARPMG